MESNNATLLLSVLLLSLREMLLGQERGVGGRRKEGIRWGQRRVGANLPNPIIFQNVAFCTENECILQNTTFQSSNLEKKESQQQTPC